MSFDERSFQCLWYTTNFICLLWFEPTTADNLNGPVTGLNLDASYFSYSLGNCKPLYSRSPWVAEQPKPVCIVPISPRDSFIQPKSKDYGKLMSFSYKVTCCSKRARLCLMAASHQIGPVRKKLILQSPSFVCFGFRQKKRKALKELAHKSASNPWIQSRFVICLVKFLQICSKY